MRVVKIPKYLVYQNMLYEYAAPCNSRLVRYVNVKYNYSECFTLWTISKNNQDLKEYFFRLNSEIEQVNINYENELRKKKIKKLRYKSCITLWVVQILLEQGYTCGEIAKMKKLDVTLLRKVIRKYKLDSQL